jgi:hypothetical protein
MHSIPVPDDLWDRAVAKAKTEGISLSGVLRKALAEFAPGPVTPTPDRQTGNPAGTGDWTI